MGMMYTHSPVERTFFCTWRAHSHTRTSSCVSHTRMAQVLEKVHCICVTSLHLAFSLLMIHLSLPLLDCHFETTPDYDLTDSDIHMILPYFPVLEAQDMRHSPPASRSLATWPDQMQTHMMEVWWVACAYTSSVLHEGACTSSCSLPPQDQPYCFSRPYLSFFPKFQ